MRTLPIAALLLLCACNLPNPTRRSLFPAGEVSGPPAPAAQPAQKPAVVERTDASLVPAPAPGSVAVVEAPLRPLEGAPTGRVWLLELYHAALAEKDALVRRGKELTRERDEALAHAAQLETARAALESRCATLEAEVRTLEDQTLELARRLAAAEIARLEVERAQLARELADSKERRP